MRDILRRRVRRSYCRKYRRRVDRIYRRDGDIRYRPIPTASASFERVQDPRPLRLQRQLLVGREGVSNPCNLANARHVP